MSQALLDKAVELAWRQWTALGVAGVAPLPDHAIDLEALIAFTPFIAAADPRLERECVDWCVRIGPRHVSISRMRQLARMMPPRAAADVIDLARLLIEGDAAPSKLSKKSRPPRLEHASLVQLRGRYIFGLGARADLIVTLVTRARTAQWERVASIGPAGYTKRAIAAVVDDLFAANILEKLTSNHAAMYKLRKRSPLLALLAPLPAHVPSWPERFALVATVLETWRRFGARPTYAIELVKALDKVRPLAAAIDPAPSFVGRPGEILDAANEWSQGLLAL